MGGIRAMTLSNKVLPSPSEMNGVAYLMSLDVVMNNGRFPSPLEVTGGSYEVINYNIQVIQFAFPSPFEVTGVNY